MKKIHPWALGITLVIVAFGIGIISIVVFVSKDPPDMVTDNYYEKDKGFQKWYETLTRSSALKAKPALLFNGASRVFMVQFPDSSNFRSVTGTVQFYHISNSKSDFEQALQLDEKGRQNFSLSACVPGAWIAKLSFATDSLDYYFEQRFVIP